MMADQVVSLARLQQEMVLSSCMRTPWSLCRNLDAGRQVHGNRRSSVQQKLHTEGPSLSVRGRIAGVQPLGPWRSCFRLLMSTRVDIYDDRVKLKECRRGHCVVGSPTAAAVDLRSRKTCPGLPKPSTVLSPCKLMYRLTSPGYKAFPVATLSPCHLAYHSCDVVLVVASAVGREAELHETEVIIYETRLGEKLPDSKQRRCSVRQGVDGLLHFEEITDVRIGAVKEAREGASSAGQVDGDRPLPSGGHLTEPQLDPSGKSHSGSSSWTLLSIIMRLPSGVRNFLLPSSFPDSVTDDYLPFIVWTFPTHVTGWAAHVLVTSSLFKAIGIGTGSASGTAAAAAAIKWVTKDGLGAVGRLLIGGRFGVVFDDDPKQWRMYAEFVALVGNILELATPLSPNSFLVLASLGHLLKAVAKGLRDPSFRVIQNHFAKRNNIGEVAAKEEVWEVGAEILGLSLGVLLLNMPGVTSSYWELVVTWAVVASIHLVLRYKALEGLYFPFVNRKRASILVSLHLEEGRVPSPKECNAAENLLLPPPYSFAGMPSVEIGCSIDQLVDTINGGDYGGLLDLVRLYSDEKYILVYQKSPQHGNNRTYMVGLKEGAREVDILRSLWQAAWLSKHLGKTRQQAGHDDRFLASSSPSEVLELKLQTSKHAGGSVRHQSLAALRASLEAVEGSWDAFMEDLEKCGWSLDRMFLAPPSGSPVLSLSIQSY